MRIFKEQQQRKTIGLIKDNPSAITIKNDNSADIHFRDCKESKLGCLGCLNPRCMFFEDADIECSEISGFPNDQSKEVCPVGALKWDYIQNIPSIDNNKCLYCGICISRCPIGAIYFDGKSQVKVNTELSEQQKIVSVDEEAARIHHEQVRNILCLPRRGVSIIASDGLFEEIYDRLSMINNQYHNIVVRNLLITLGCSCSMRRIGDVYTRMDAVYSSIDGVFGAVEIEYGRDTLDASRAVLDDIAVLFTRYSIRKEYNKALVVCLSLPNARQGYWQVVRDVRIVEDIKIQTLTIGSLMLLLWNGALFKPKTNEYYIDFDNKNLRTILLKQLNLNRFNLSNGHLGILEPLK